jgi:hypothetical protein
MDYSCLLHALYIAPHMSNSCHIGRWLHVERWVHPNLPPTFACPWQAVSLLVQLLQCLNSLQTNLLVGVGERKPVTYSSSNRPHAAAAAAIPTARPAGLSSNDAIGHGGMLLGSPKSARHPGGMWSGKGRGVEEPTTCKPRMRPSPCSMTDLTRQPQWCGYE